jgi:hypothetical protein
MILDGSDDIQESTKILSRLDNMWATCQRRFTANFGAQDTLTKDTLMIGCNGKEIFLIGM